ncbi:MAG: hypothetical protein MZV64_52945 [Ignavibacteriales bacterium]|nr:hypothetical protein [Ignavibacteriales bacterium]
MVCGWPGRRPTRPPRSSTISTRRAAMPDLPKKKVGLISCSGEELPEGTVTRRAVRKVLETLRPDDTVTLCLPLFLAGGEGKGPSPVTIRPSPWTAATSAAPRGPRKMAAPRRRSRSS